MDKMKGTEAVYLPLGASCTSTISDAFFNLRFGHPSLWNVKVPSELMSI